MDVYPHPFNRRQKNGFVIPSWDEIKAGGRQTESRDQDDLRLLHASMLIKAQLTPVEVAERLGHTNPSVTLDTYGHLFRDHQEEQEVSLIEYLPGNRDNN